MSTIAIVIATAAACGLPMLYLHAQLTKARAMLTAALDDRAAHRARADQLAGDCYALRQALVRERERAVDPYRHRLATGTPRAWGPS